MAKASCIIPVYNEADRVGPVLDALQGHELIDEIIVIDDGSTDNTAEVLGRRRGINFISLDKNRGKSYAVAHGLSLARNDLVVMVDSDLVGLNPKNITDLIEPVIENQADIAISLRSNSLAIFRWLGMDFVSGERVFHKTLLPDLTKLSSLKSYMIESYMNQLIVKNKLRIKVVDLKNVIHPMKFAKIGFWRGMIRDFKMIFQIVCFLGLGGFLNQYYKMLKLRI